MSSISTISWLVVPALALALLAGCDGEGPLVEEREGDPATASALRGIAALPQRIPAGDGRPELFPGQANLWDLAPDFRIASGGDGQFTPMDPVVLETGALALSVTVDPDTLDESSVDFPSDMSWSELTWFSPELGPANGVTVALVDDGATSVPVLEGSYSAYLAPTRDSRIAQSVDLSGAAAPMLAFTYSIEAGGRELSDEPCSFRVVARDAAGGIVAGPFVDEDACGTTAVGASVSVGPLPSDVVTLSFERSGPSTGGATLVDAVSVSDGQTPLPLTNGDFETGNLAGWTRNDLVTVRSVTAAPRTLVFRAGQADEVELVVTRSFYSPPGSLWGRMVDVFENRSDEVINTSAEYSLASGAGTQAIIYETPDADGLAATIWDGSGGGTRDVGWGFGIATDVDFVSDDALGDMQGSGVVHARYLFGTPAGGSIGIASFVVMTGDTTGRPRSVQSNDPDDCGRNPPCEVVRDFVISDRATLVDAELQRIVAGYPFDRSVNQYSEGLTREQLDAIANY